MKCVNKTFIFPTFVVFSSKLAAPVTYRAQWSRPGVQSELQTTGRGGRMDRAHSEETLVSGQEYSHLCAIRDQNPGQKQPGLGARAKDSDWLLRRGL